MGVDRGSLCEAIFDGASDGILIVDEGGRILLVNDAVGRLLGYSADDLVGQSVEVLIPKRYEDHAAQRSRYAQDPIPRSMGRGIILFARNRDGSEIPVDISLTPLAVGGRRLVSAAVRDLRGRSYGLDALRVQATALRSAANGVVITDIHGVISWVNPAACTITGYASGELVGQHTRILKSGKHGPEFYAALWNTITRGETWFGTIVNRRKDGTLYHEEQTIAPVVDDSGTITHFIAIKRDVTEQRRLQAELQRANAELAQRMVEIEALNGQLREQSIRDPLTQLHNRRYLDDAVGAELARARREQKPISIAMLDVDRFKEVNDSLGHAAGDQVLRHVAESFRTFVRCSDLVCRLGGDEFLVVMPGASADAAFERAESWRASFAETPIEMCGGKTITCTLSIGVAEHRPDHETIRDTIRRADLALYRAKDGGRNLVVREDD